MSAMTSTPEWPLGPALEHARTTRGLSTREAARLAEMSDTLWRTLERGYELKRGHRFPASPRADKVARAAKVVGLDVTEALRMAGLDPLDAEPVPGPDLSHVSDDHLLMEVRRRMAPGGQGLVAIDTTADKLEGVPGSGPSPIRPVEDQSG
jgi:transcriptional regulator with XRE-family HTH domain